MQEGITIGEKPLKEHLEAIGHKEVFYYVEEYLEEELKRYISILETANNITKDEGLEI